MLHGIYLILVYDQIIVNICAATPLNDGQTVDKFYHNVAYKRSESWML